MLQFDSQLSHGHSLAVRCGFWGRLLNGHRNIGFDCAEVGAEGMSFAGRGRARHVIPDENIVTPLRATLGIIWGHLEIDAGSNFPRRLYGLPSESLASFVAQANKALDARLRARYDESEHRIAAALDAASLLFSGDRYVRFSHADAWVNAFANTEAIMAAIPERLLSAKEVERHERLRSMLADADTAAADANERYIISETRKWAELFDTVDAQPLTPAQRRACIVDEIRQRIVAGAGTGKTSTMVAKIAYLVRSGKASPGDIYALSYGGDAATELQERLEQAGLTSVKTSTIHSLGSKLLRMSGNRSQLTPFAEKDNAQAFAAEIQSYIDDLAEDESVAKDILAFISEHPRPERTPESFASYEQYLDWTRYGRPRALQGEFVKSFAELSIANFLWFNRVEYCYEKRYEFEVSAPTKKPYAPDFYLPKYGIYIEHFGVDRNNDPGANIDKATYVAGMEWKRHVHKTHKTTLIETFSWMRSDGNLLSRLRELLREKNVDFSERTVREALDSIGGRDAASTLARLMAQVIPAFKESGRRTGDLESSFTDIDITRTTVFYRLFPLVYDRYQAMLRDERQIDFADMIAGATDAVLSGRATADIAYLMVDEFQDVSPGRGRFLKALAEQTRAALCVVGDDWQAIYNFSGCDGGLFTKFDEYFGRAASNVLADTFRFNDAILRVTSSFIQANPYQLPKTLRTERRTSGHSVILLEQERETAIDAALQWLTKTAHFEGDVTFLTRTNAVLDTVPLYEVRRDYQLGKTRAMTAHGAKGLQADAVIILNVSEKGGGFPSKQETDPILRVVLPPVEPFPFAEERRLFYVALTRARNYIVVCFDRGSPSPFVRELAKLPDVHAVSVAGRPLLSAAVVCKICSQGTYKYKEAKRTGDPYYRCPNCGDMVSPCPECSGVLDYDGNFWKCTNVGCSRRVPRCPSCRRGVLKKFSGPFGAFVGCSRFDKDDPNTCRYKSKDLGKVNL